MFFWSVFPLVKEKYTLPVAVFIPTYLFVVAGVGRKGFENTFFRGDFTIPKKNIKTWIEADKRIKKSPTLFRSASWVKGL